MDSLRKLDGIFPLFKPKGVTSAKCLEDLKRTLQEGVCKKPLSQRTFSKICKVGHGGTLDPLATGVLVVGLNGGCKLLGRALSGRKVYRFAARLGEHYNTYDCTGSLLEQMPVPSGLSQPTIELACRQFVGPQIMQRPPPFSAVHVGGKRAYDMARAGELTELPPKPVRIDRLSFLSYDEPTQILKMEMECGGGTYVRSLIVDLATALGTRAHLVELERTLQEPFSIEQCLQVEECRDLERIQSILRSP